MKLLRLLSILSITLCLLASCSRRDTTGQSTGISSAESNQMQGDSGYVTAGDSVPDNAAGRPQVLEFSATWCGPCKQQKPIFEQAVSKYGSRISMTSVDVDANPELAQRYNVDAVPTFIFIDGDGRIVGRANFLNAVQLDKALQHLLSLAETDKTNH